MQRRIDPTADRAVYRQLADILREQIQSGALQPGQQLPSEGSLAQEYELGRNSVRQALALLRGEGLIVVKPRLGAYVRAARPIVTVSLGLGDRVSVRMPTDTERRRLDIPGAVALLVVERASGEEELHPGDRTVLEVHG
jgi:GntR family transcriptional regulator